MMNICGRISVLVVTIAICVASAFASAVSALGETGQSTTSHGISMYGDLKYKPDFPHFAYVNPQAAKGGEVRLSSIGTFDTLNPFTLKGVVAAGVGQVFDTLAAQSDDEPFSEYGLIAETIEIPADRSWVAFTLRPQARFHDGSPITADDVIWTFETLKTKGHPLYRSYYAKVVNAENLGPQKVKFHFSPGENRELPLIVGQLPVLSRAYWSTRDFEKTTLEPPLGSGPYQVQSVDPGRAVVYRRVPNYWAAQLPVRVGHANFDRIRYDYYRDTTVALEAFKAGQYDFRQENVAKNWATAYNTPAVTRGLIKKEQIPNQIPTGMQGFVYNTRRPVFQDSRVRRALAYAFDFEWTNKNLFYGAYKRTKSYYSNSELAARGQPSPDEFAILAPFRGHVPEEVFTTEYQPPHTDGLGNVRDNLITALTILKEAGWVVQNTRLVNEHTAEPFTFEILLDDPSFERVALPFVKNLERLGITASVRTVDTAQYQNRIDNFDFDMTVAVWGQSLSPGNEQVDYWTSARADVPGSRNLAGIKDSAVDQLVMQLIAASTRASLVAHTRALDRVLVWGHYVIPHWYLQDFRVAYWDKFGRPQNSPPYALGFDTWWVNVEKEAQVMNRKENKEE